MEKLRDKLKKSSVDIQSVKKSAIYSFRRERISSFMNKAAHCTAQPTESTSMDLDVAPNQKKIINRKRAGTDSPQSEKSPDVLEDCNLQGFLALISAGPSGYQQNPYSKVVTTQTLSVKP